MVGACQCHTTSARHHMDAQAQPDARAALYACRTTSGAAGVRTSDAGSDKALSVALRTSAVSRHIAPRLFRVHQLPPDKIPARPCTPCPACWRASHAHRHTTGSNRADSSATKLIRKWRPQRECGSFPGLRGGTQYKKRRAARAYGPSALCGHEVEA